MEEELLVDELEIETPVDEEDDVVIETDSEPEPEPDPVEEPEEEEIDPDKALEIARQRYAHLFKEEESDSFEEEIIKKAINASREVRALANDVLTIARRRMGEYANDADAVEYMRMQIEATPPEFLKQALVDPTMVDRAFYAYVGERAVKTKKVAPKNTSVSPQVKDTRSTVTISREDKEDYDKMRMMVADLPPERAKKFKERWLKEKGYR